MGILTEMILKADIIERTFSPDEDSTDDRPEIRIERLRDQLAKLDSDHHSLKLLTVSGNEFGRALLKKKLAREAASALCDLFLFAKQAEVDLEGALQEHWHRQLANKYYG